MHMKRKRVAALTAALLILVTLFGTFQGASRTASAKENAAGMRSDGAPPGVYLGDEIYRLELNGNNLDEALKWGIRNYIADAAAGQTVIVQRPSGPVSVNIVDTTDVDGGWLENGISMNGTGGRASVAFQANHLWRGADGTPVYCFDIAADDAGERTARNWEDIPDSFIDKERAGAAFRMASWYSANNFANLKSVLPQIVREAVSQLPGVPATPADVLIAALQNNTNALQSMVQRAVWIYMHDGTASTNHYVREYTPANTVIVKGEVVTSPESCRAEVYNTGELIDFPAMIGIGIGNGSPAETPGIISSGAVPGSITSPNAVGGQILIFAGPVTGYLRAIKQSAEAGITEGNRMYPLNGIRFGVFRDEACTEAALDDRGQAVTLTAGADGRTQTVELPVGAYWIREEAASLHGWAPAAEAVRTEITAENTAEAPVEIRVTNTPVYAAPGLLLTKIDAETGQPVPQGTASLEGAEFTVRYFDAEEPSGTPVRTWVFRTDAGGEVRLDAEHLASGDELYTDPDGHTVIPLGTLTVQETGEPEGYLPDSSVYTIHVTQATDGTARVEMPGNVSSLRVSEQIRRMNLRILKLDIDGNAMPGIPFRIDRLTAAGEVAESREAVTGRNGILDTSRADCGVWFGEPSARSSAETSERGALIYADYRISELPCAANSGHDLPTREVPLASGGLFEDGSVYDMGAAFIDLEVHPESDLLDALSGTKCASVGEKVTLTDTFRYDHLKTTETYRLETEIVWRSADGGQTRPLGSGSITFTPPAVDATQTAGGIIANTVTVPAAGLSGGAFHAVDRLYLVSGTGEILLTAHNEDLSDPRQSVGLPMLATDARDTRTGNHVGACTTEARIEDVVTYENLAHGGLYVIEGTLRDAETGDAVLGADGQSLTVTKVLRINDRLPEVIERDGIAAGPSSGQVTMPAFEFDASDAGGRTYVVTEILRDHDTGEIVFEHADLTDEAQTIRYPGVATQAADETSGDRVGSYGSGLGITDTLQLTNLTVGENYYAAGTLLDRESGETMRHADGSPVTARTEEFTADSREMTVRVSFDLSGTEGISASGNPEETRYDLAGRTLVCFEELYCGNAAVGRHCDPEDEGQAVHFPEIATTATAADTQDHVTGGHEETTVTDAVSYANLLTDGREYTVSGYLVDRESGAPLLIGGERVTAETAFVPEQPEGIVTLTFDFDAAALAGTTLVAFEELSYRDTRIAVHADLRDESQTIYIPEIRTRAHDARTGTDHTRSDGEAVLIDTVTYTDLLPGRAYTLRGTLVDQTTGEPTPADGERITSELIFTPESSSGSVDMTFTFDASLLRGTTVVAFEELYCGDVLIAAHADTGDADQTDHIPEIATTAVFADTQDHISEPDAEETVVDTVVYRGLKPNTKYTLTGILTDRATGDPLLVNGRPVTNSVTFVTDSADGEQGGAGRNRASVSGSVELSFTFDASAAAGTTAVAFETLSHNGREVAVHADLEDEDQTVCIPRISTQAADRASGTQTLRLGTRSVLADTVRFEGLLPGREYVIRGVLMDQATGEPVSDEGLIVGETVFTPDASSGEAEVVFHVNTTRLHGHALVVFERLYLTEDADRIIARHEDIHDASQTVTVPERAAVPTGDETPVRTILGIAVSSGAALTICTVCMRNRGRKNGRDGKHGRKETRAAR